MIKYNVEVHTGKKSGAGTDANVFLDIFGEQGDTGERPLSKSKTNRNKFEKGNVSTCRFPDLIPDMEGHHIITLSSRLSCFA